MSTNNLTRDAGLSFEARQRLRQAIDRYGGQSAVAREMGISRQGLNAVLRSGKGISLGRLADIASIVGVSVDFVLNEPTAADAQVDIVQVPIVEIEASAGPGLSPLANPSIVDHLPMPAWLARQLGEVSSLRIVTARGDSGEPDIRDGDLVMFDSSKPFRGEGMYVIVLDGDLAIKRLQKSGLSIRVLSSNLAYSPIEIPAGDVEERLRALGRVVWSGKQW